MVATLLKTTAIAATILVATTEAHNKMTLPLPTWPEGVYNQNSPSGTIDPAKALPAPKGMGYNTDPGSNTKAYWTAFNASSYKSLKELAWKTQTLADKASKECGFSTVKGTARALPAKVEWDFFTASHQGPCEVWCDDTLVFENWNCAVDYPDTPAKLPYDKSKCSGASMLTSYWIALHSTPWQVYTNCAPLSGGSSTSKSTTSTDTSGSSGSTPAAQTPSSGGSPSTSTTESSSAGSPVAQTSSSGGSPSTSTTDSSSANSPTAQTPSSGGSPSTSTTDSSSANTPTVTSAPSSGGSPSTTTAPSSNTSPSTSTNSSPSTSTTDESDCGSLDVAGGSGDENKDNNNTYQGESQTNNGGSTNTGTESQTNNSGNTNTGTNTGTKSQTNNGGSTNTGTQNNGGNNNQYWSGGDSNQYWSNNGGNSNQYWSNTAQTNTGTGSQNSYNFNSLKGNTNAGTVAPQSV